MTDDIDWSKWNGEITINHELVVPGMYADGVRQLLTDYFDSVEISETLPDGKAVLLIKTDKDIGEVAGIFEDLFGEGNFAQALE